MNTLSLKKTIALTALTIGIWCGSTVSARELTSTTVIPFCPTASTTCVINNMGITSIAPGTFAGYTNLRELYLAGNQISSIESGNFVGLSSVRRLDLNGNKITLIEKGDFNGLYTLTQLYLNGNQISSIENGDFNGPSNLQGLSLKNNQITSITNLDFTGLSSLQNLSLLGNKISSIESGDFYGLSSLKDLDLYGNQISSIENGDFYGLSSLINLSVVNNQIKSIESGDFYGLSNLTHLYLQGNQITSIESGDFDGLSNLTNLELGANQISSIESGDFDGLSNLTYLYLQGNQITSIESGDFSGLSNLTTLVIGYNQITSIENGDFYGLSKLQSIDLYNNKITSIESDDFFGLSSLTDLYLNQNRITSIENGDFSGLSKLQRLNLVLNCINTTDSAFQTYINSLLIPTLSYSEQNICSIPIVTTTADCPTCRTVTCVDQFETEADDETLCPQPKPITGSTVQAGAAPWCVAPLVNHGVCGTLDGTTTPNTPPTPTTPQFCQNGLYTRINTAGTGAWSRTCAGNGGGDTVPCGTIAQTPIVASTRTVTCNGTQPANTTPKNGTTYIQTLVGSNWTPIISWTTLGTNGSCGYKCADNYTRNPTTQTCDPDTGTADTRTVDCNGVQPANTIPKNGTTYIQTLVGSNWTPTISWTTLGTNGSCGYDCTANYTRNPTTQTCIADTRTVTCGTQPANTTPTNGTTYIQTRNGTQWDPTVSWTQGASTCGYNCAPNYTRNPTTQTCIADTRTVTCGTQPANTTPTNGTTYIQTRNGTQWAPIVSWTLGANICGYNTYSRWTGDWGTCNVNNKTTVNGTDFYFWYKENGICEESQTGAVCQGNGNTNEKITRDGMLYERQNGEQIYVNDTDSNRCMEYLLNPRRDGWKIQTSDCAGNSGTGAHTRDALRDGCSINTDEQSCTTYAINPGMYQQGGAEGECNWIQVRESRTDTFVCKDLWGNTVADSLCVYKPKPANMMLSCDQGGPGNPDSLQTGGGYDTRTQEDREQQEQEDTQGQNDEDRGYDYNPYD